MCSHSFRLNPVTLSFSFTQPLYFSGLRLSLHSSLIHLLFSLFSLTSPLLLSLFRHLPLLFSLSPFYLSVSLFIMILANLQVHVASNSSPLLAESPYLSLMLTSLNCRSPSFCLFFSLSLSFFFPFSLALPLSLYFNLLTLSPILSVSLFFLQPLFSLTPTSLLSHSLSLNFFHILGLSSSHLLSSSCDESLFFSFSLILHFFLTLPLFLPQFSLPFSFCFSFFLRPFSVTLCFSFFPLSSLLLSFFPPCSTFSFSPLLFQSPLSLSRAFSPPVSLSLDISLSLSILSLSPALCSLSLSILFFSFLSYSEADL